MHLEKLAGASDFYAPRQATPLCGFLGFGNLQMMIRILKTFYIIILYVYIVSIHRNENVETRGARVSLPSSQKDAPAGRLSKLYSMIPTQPSFLLLVPLEQPRQPLSSLSFSSSQPSLPSPQGQPPAYLRFSLPLPHLQFPRQLRLRLLCQA